MNKREVLAHEFKHCLCGALYLSSKSEPFTGVLASISSKGAGEAALIHPGKQKSWHTALHGAMAVGPLADLKGKAFREALKYKHWTAGNVLSPSDLEAMQKAAIAEEEKVDLVLATRFYCEDLGAVRLAKAYALLADPLLQKSLIPLDALVDDERARHALQKAKANRLNLELDKRFGLDIPGKWGHTLEATA